MKHHHKKKISWLVEGALIACVIIIFFQGLSYLLSRISPSEVTVESVAEQKVTQPRYLQFVQDSVAQDTFPRATSSIVTSSSSSLIIATSAKPVDIDMLSITMKPWVWVGSMNPNGTTVYPNKGIEYTATFDLKDTLQVRAGCKTGFGLYSLNEANLSIHDMIVDEKGCIDEDKKIDEYINSFNDVSYYSFNKRGELVLRTKGLRGGMIFK